MGKQKNVKCRYNHCPHPDDLRPPEEMVKGNGCFYYHKECAHERDMITRIVDYYLEKVDDRATVAQLRNVVNNIVFKKRVPADELFFYIQYTINSEKRINSPYALHYLIDNKKLQSEYKKHLESTKPKFDVADVPVAEEVQYTPKSKKAGFGSII